MLAEKYKIVPKDILATVACHDWTELCENVRDYPEIVVHNDGQPFQVYNGLIEQNHIAHFLHRLSLPVFGEIDALEIPEKLRIHQKLILGIFERSGAEFFGTIIFITNLKQRK